MAVLLSGVIVLNSLAMSSLTDLSDYSTNDDLQKARSFALYAIFAAAIAILPVLILFLSSLMAGSFAAIASLKIFIILSLIVEVIALLAVVLLDLVAYTSSSSGGSPSQYLLYSFLVSIGGSVILILVAAVWVYTRSKPKSRTEVTVQHENKGEQVSGTQRPAEGSKSELAETSEAPSSPTKAENVEPGNESAAEEETMGVHNLDDDTLGE